MHEFYDNTPIEQERQSVDKPPLQVAQEESQFLHY